MAKTNGDELPFLVAGGGIGGLITAYALARKGFPVPVFEQAGEFKELGAGIQLGPNIFRAIERVGLKAGMMDDAWVPPSLEMRDALTGDLVTSIPLGEPFMKRFGQPYAVTHRADIHGVYLRACQGNNLVSLENSREVEDFVDEGDAVAIHLEGGEEVRGRALIGCASTANSTTPPASPPNCATRCSAAVRPSKPMTAWLGSMGGCETSSSGGPRSTAGREGRISAA